MMAKLEKDKPASENAQRAKKIAETMPDEMRQAVEAMGRTVRARKAAFSEQPPLRYRQVD